MSAAGGGFPDPASPLTDSNPEPELLERLRGPDGAGEKERILLQLKEMDARLTAESLRLQSAERMRQIEAARLAVASALSIINRVVPSPTDKPTGG
jgi:hypothetical protein